MAWQILTNNKKPTEGGETLPYLFTEWQLKFENLWEKIGPAGAKVKRCRWCQVMSMGKSPCEQKQMCQKNTSGDLWESSQNDPNKKKIISNTDISQQFCTWLPEHSWKKAWGLGSLLDMWVGIEPSSSTAWGVASQRSSGWWWWVSCEPYFTHGKWRVAKC